MTDRVRPDFGTPMPAIKSAFRRIATGLKMARSQQLALLEAFIDGHWSGDDRKLRGLARPVFDQRPWSWPWFDQCAVRLEAAGVWPRSWRHHFLTPGCRWRDAAQDVKEEYLLQTLAGAAYTDSHAAQLNDADVRRHLRVTLKVGDERCEAERLVCDEHREAIEAYDFSRLPPYFPMCGVGLRAVSRHGTGG